MKTPTINTLQSEKEYKFAMAQIDVLMKKGPENLNAADVRELQELVTAAELYEDKHYPLPMPDSLKGIIELKMFEMRLKQKEMAQLLDITESKLSQILNNKREPDLSFLKAIYTKLNIDPKFILDHI